MGKMKSLLKSFLGRYGAWCSVQNLDKRPGDGYRATGNILKRGRGWLHFKRGSKVGAQWNLASKSCRVEFGIHSESGFQLRLAFPPVAVYLHARLQQFSDLYYKYDWYDIGFAIHGATIWVRLWADDREQRYYGSFWSPYRRRFNWTPLDTFLGDLKHAVEKTISTTPIVVAMTEASYKGEVKLQIETWKRPRWPHWPSKMAITRAHIEMEEPIPVPGKGTCSHNCGEDATYSMCCKADNVPEAIAAITQSTLRQRQRYGGGVDWKPERAQSQVEAL